MTSFSEMGKRSEKSSFSLTCSLLSQYIKEKGCPADLGLGRAIRSVDPAVLGKPEEYRPPTTMSLLPGVAVSGEDIAGDNTKSIELFPLQPTKQPEKAQLTIFYGGKVIVFDKFPAEKARDLMQLASKGSGASVQNFSLAPPSAAAAAAADVPSCPAPANPPANPPASFSAQPQPGFSDLPIARKASLHRFLEKRKDRITAKAPYQVNGSEGSKDAVCVKQEEICQPWLGLGPQISNTSS